LATDNPDKKKKGPPPCDLTVTRPEKDGSKLVTRATVTSPIDQMLHIDIVIKNHKRMWRDDTVGEYEDVASVEPGKPFKYPLNGDCKNGRNEYFAKITARSKDFSDPAEFHTDRVEIRC
jgi:hypothetical protein